MLMHPQDIKGNAKVKKVYNENLFINECKYIFMQH